MSPYAPDRIAGRRVVIDRLDRDGAAFAALLRDRGADVVIADHAPDAALPEGCVLVYPPAAWEPVRARAETFPSFHPQASWWKRLLLGFEEHVTPDGSGRVLLSGALRQHGAADGGVPAGVDSFRIAREVFAEIDKG